MLLASVAQYPNKITLLVLVVLLDMLCILLVAQQTSQDNEDTSSSANAPTETEANGARADARELEGECGT